MKNILKITFLIPVSNSICMTLKLCSKALTFNVHLTIIHFPLEAKLFYKQIIILLKV